MHQSRQQFFRLYCLATIVLCLLSCSKQSASSSSTSNTSNPTTTDSASSIASFGENSVAACSGENNNSEPCYWFYKFDPTKCSEASPCSKAVFFASGGEDECDEAFTTADHPYRKIADDYASSGYFFVCLGVFKSNIPISVSRHSLGARLDTLIKNIRASTAAKVWNGKYLLHSGISWGATAPVVVMARSQLDNDPTWQGQSNPAGLTAACYYDGTYEPLTASAYYQYSSILTGGDCNFVRNASICNPYMNGQSNCADPSIATNTDLAQDTIVNIDPNEFAIKRWKLVECGSGLGLPYCAKWDETQMQFNIDRDWTPATPTLTLCNNINTASAAGYSCEAGSLPTLGHIGCSNNANGILECRNWFEQSLNALIPE